MPISSFYSFCFYNHLLLFTAYSFNTDHEHICHLTAARLAQLGERRSAEREVVSSNPGRTNTQGLKITEEKVLSL